MTVTPVAYEQLVISNEWDNEYYHLLQRKLRGFNRRFATMMEPPEALPLNIKVLNREGEVVGGMAALTYWGWLVIKFLVIDDEFRGNGLGHKLIEAAHVEALRRGCTRAHTATYDFQALTYYQRFGYRVVGQLTDYPDGYNYHWLRKDFEEPYAPADDASSDSTAILPDWADGM